MLLLLLLLLRYLCTSPGFLLAALACTDAIVSMKTLPRRSRAHHDAVKALKVVSLLLLLFAICRSRCAPTFWLCFMLSTRAHTVSQLHHRQHIDKVSSDTLTHTKTHLTKACANIW